MAIVTAALLSMLIPVYSHADTSVSIVNGSYSPSDVTVAPGTTVTWTNNGTVAHTVTADDGSFGSPMLNPGDSYSHTFSTAGTFRYYCIPHGGPGGVGMSAILRVSSATSTGSTTGTTTPSTGTTTVPMSTSTPGTQSEINHLLQIISILRAQIQFLLDHGFGGQPPDGFPGDPHDGRTDHPSMSDEGVAVYADNYTVEPGDWVTFSGNGFGSNEDVRITEHGMTIATAHTDSGGSFSASHQAPNEEMSVTVTFTGVMSGRTDSVDIDIEAED